MSLREKLSPQTLGALAIGGLILLGALLFGFSGQGQVPQLTMQSLKGETIQIPQGKKLTLVNFWATSCPSCVEEMPYLQAFQQKYDGKIQVVAVAMSYDDEKAIRHFMQKHQLNFPVVFDQDGSIAEAFGKIRLTPTNYLIAKDGDILYKKIGTPDFDLWSAKIPG